LGFKGSKKFESKNNDKYKYANSGKVNGGEMVKDPMCNTYIPKKNAVKDTVKGETYYFCSKECRDQFIKKIKD
jgi:YHS domain-containing protein